MNARSLKLDGETAALQAQRRHFEALLTEREDLLAQRTEEVAFLKEQVRLLLANRFGASAETVSEAQLGLFNEAELEGVAEESAEPVIVPEHERKRPKRKPLPEDLPRVEVIHDLDEADKLCPRHGVALEPMGEERSEQLDIVPAKVQVLHHIRKKYRCPCCEGLLRTASMPPQPVPKSLASPGLLAYITTAKFIDALPLYRQVQIFSRLGVEMSRATVAGWMVRCGELVQPLINLLREQMLAQPYLQMDETTVQVLNEAGKAPESKSYLWAQRSVDPERPIVLFDYDPSRSGEVPKRLLEGFAGTLQTDGYSGYNPITAAAGLTRLYCMAHARRKFVDAIKAAGINPKRLPPKPPDKARRALKALGFIRTLYAIERRIKNQSPQERYRVRQAESVPVLDQLKRWLDHTRPRVTPKSRTGKALAYLDEHWAGLIAYCDDGRYHIDNNALENEIRPFCVGRRNWLFSSTVAGAKSSANLYSLVQSAKANGLEPYAYLRHVFTELPKAQTVEDIEALLPYRITDSALRKKPSPS